ncbi:uncharacterized protein EV154DRAFT_564611 [Mucor mucedo]|uniref:uncharacterized protein n=1 Tax=Mucor mucedo TaxID=29922 RepID=UPI00221EAFBD|nr:uncharacterized protein EV154DRAFT_564611 [Mucor mucedo]KAI7890128.1 hypothetical protein EV154DRAFT_564611 [Mucor mucedo]
MPMILFGDGLKNKSHVRYKGLRYEVIDKLYRQLKRRENLELLLLDIGEYNTSKVKHAMAVSIEEYVPIATSIWNGNGSPSVFQRQSATSNVVAAPSSVTA